MSEPETVARGGENSIASVDKNHPRIKNIVFFVQHLAQREHEVGGRGNAERADRVTVSRCGLVMRKPLARPTISQDIDTDTNSGIIIL